ncbi:amino acid adenylation domain-containing protein [Prevotella aff. ruminicola Tc2-24]|jgi:amino acid adenylation domain-containing protein|uniref:Amino acid adenylation domain-containing protein n=1 Tax=Prevotella aff. ruminicola Tc2-24 TaxID=81582 RepID=A0A1I0NIA4_9BACT|nr:MULTISPECIES: amino acid adenylation domain-containing protein [Prevotella]SEE28333.1 amino acid adenylation domain-containing protein [Prevotella sp. lc2012]SEW00919.1 amino acid adenylation domain-containing protein [Prevotella aff. ruminicola Tc2-24]
MKINLIELFEETADKYPHKIAVIDKDKDITFCGLRDKAMTLAQKIINGGIGQNKPVAVFLDKSIESVFANLGIIYSGNFYMNLDIKTPAERISNILKLVEPYYIISTSKQIKSIAGIIPESIRVILLDEEDWEEEVDKKAILGKLSTIIDTDPSCIINTSGSTGTPKGVVLNHKSFFDFIEWALDTFKFDENLVMGSLSPLVFDIYSFELCMLMAKASTLVVLPSNLAAFPAKILDLLEQHKVNFLFWVPTIMVNIANMDLLSTYKLEHLKTVWFAGEVFPTKQFNYWHHHLPQVTFANLYGPIEITLDCTYYIVDKNIPDEQPLPIGIPCRNTDILILDGDDKAVKEPYKEGELCVRGTSLAMGYYNNPEKTAAAFVQNPLNKSYPELIYRTGDIVCYDEDGLIMFKGRKDNIVKHLGYRTDLGEIEHVIINTLKLVKNGCVVYHQAAKEITLIYEAEQEISASDFRKKIGQALPKYMIPTVYRHVDLLQRNTNGKIDRLYYKKLING